MNDDFLFVLDIYAWAQAVLVDKTAIEVVDPVIPAVVILTDVLDCCGVRHLYGAEGEVGGIVIFCGSRILEIFACTDGPQCPALAFHILNVPDSTVGDVETSLVVQAVDETAIASDGL